MAAELVTAAKVAEAYEHLKGAVTHTPLQYDRYLSEKYSANVYLKREDLQIVRSFKLRGAYYAIKSLPKDKLANGVVCASAGNHAQGVAYTCHEIKVPAVIFMPTTTPNQKISQVKFFGGEEVTIKLVGDTFDASAKAAQDYAVENQMSFVDPFNDLHIIAGQGTLAVEALNDAKAKDVKIDMFLAAIGGGGLISGISSYVKGVSPETEVVGVEANGSKSMHAAFENGSPIAIELADKFADGVAVKKVGSLTYEHAKKNVDRLVSVPEGQISSTILELYGKQAIVAEPAGALSVAALEVMKDEIKGKTVVCVISGGNNDINRMAEIEERSLIFEGLQHYFVIHFPQRPGALREFMTNVLGENDDITRFEYTKRVNRSSGPAVIGVLLQNKEEIGSLCEKIAAFDPKYIDLNENQTLYTLLV